MTGKALTTVGGGTSVAWNLYISSDIDFYYVTQFPALSISLIVHSCVPSQCSHLIISSSHQQQHLSLDREGRWGTTDDFGTVSSILSCSPLPFGTWRTPGLSIP